MVSGPRRPPPDLAGFSHIRWLGGGGFADVFLYRQERPSREVAIKVLLSEALDADERTAFDAEADRMASLSHPFIVTIHGADTANDGRPYLIMANYGRAHYGVLAKQGGIAVADAVRLGVQVTSAVAVAHRAGILHRDIKPANILVDNYGNPGLTDFGISGGRHDVSQGYSVPFSAPEVLSDVSPGDEQSDVYGLAATIYTILAGHSPFEIVGGDNSRKSITARVLNSPVLPLRRPDVPPLLAALLAHAMDKDPAARPRSALAFARELQKVERDMRVAVTPIDVPDERAPVRPKDSDDVDGTNVGRLQVVSQSPRTAPAPPLPAPVPTAPPSPPDVSGGPNDVRYTSPPGPAPVAASLPDGGLLDTAPRLKPARPAVADPAAANGSVEPLRKVPRGAIVAASVLVVALSVLAAVALLGGGKQAATGAAPDDVEPVELLDLPARPTNVHVGAVESGLEVSWDAPGSKDGDRFRVSRAGEGSSDSLVEALKSPVVLEGVEPGCFQVEAIRAGQISQPATGCPG